MIAFRVRGGAVQVALVTTRGGKRWVLPKGSVERGEHPRQAAVRETAEEAGLRGRVRPRPIGTYRYFKGRVACNVVVYLMQVTRVLDRWPERRHRRRRWYRAEDAAQRLPAPARECLRRVLCRLASAAAAADPVAVTWPDGR